jgi:hypothetical protein
MQKVGKGDWQTFSQNFFDPYPLSVLIVLIINLLHKGYITL